MPSFTTGANSGPVQLLAYVCTRNDGVPRRVWQKRLVPFNHERGEGRGESDSERSGLSSRCERYSTVVICRSLIHTVKRVSHTRSLSMVWSNSCHGRSLHAMGRERILNIVLRGVAGKRGIRLGSRWKEKLSGGPSRELAPGV
jgi:hypothetical protein